MFLREAGRFDVFVGEAWRLDIFVREAGRFEVCVEGKQGGLICVCCGSWKV